MHIIQGYQAVEHRITSYFLFWWTKSTIPQTLNNLHRVKFAIERIVSQSKNIQLPSLRNYIMHKTMQMIQAER